MLNQFAVEIPTLPVDQCHSDDEIPPLFRVFSNTPVPLFFCTDTQRSWNDGSVLSRFFRASTAVWECSLGSTSCLLVVVQRILFDPSRLD